MRSDSLVTAAGAGRPPATSPPLSGARSRQQPGLEGKAHPWPSPPAQGFGSRLPSRARSPAGPWPLGAGTRVKRSDTAGDPGFSHAAHLSAKGGDDTFYKGQKSRKSRAPLAYSQAGHQGKTNRDRLSRRTWPPPPALRDGVPGWGTRVRTHSQSGVRRVSSG